MSIDFLALPAESERRERTNAAAWMWYIGHVQINRLDGKACERAGMSAPGEFDCNRPTGPSAPGDFTFIGPAATHVRRTATAPARTTRIPWRGV